MGKGNLPNSALWRVLFPSCLTNGVILTLTGRPLEKMRTGGKNPAVLPARGRGCMVRLRGAYGGRVNVGSRLGTTTSRALEVNTLMATETIHLRCVSCGLRWERNVPLTDGELVLRDDLCPRCEAQGIVECLSHPLRQGTTSSRDLGRSASGSPRNASKPPSSVRRRKRSL